MTQDDGSAGVPVPGPVTHWTQEKLDEWDMLWNGVKEAARIGWWAGRREDLSAAETRDAVIGQIYLMVWQTEAGNDVKRAFLEDEDLKLTWEGYIERYGPDPDSAHARGMRRT